MSVESVALVLRHSPVRGTDKVVLIGIADHDGDGGSWPSIDTLSEYANVSRRNVEKAISRLVEAGELAVHERQGGTLKTPNSWRTNRYEILTKPRQRRKATGGDPSQTTGGDPSQTTGGDPSQTTGCPVANDGYAPSQTTGVIEPPNNHPEPPVEPSGAGASAGERTGDTGHAGHGPDPHPNGWQPRPGKRTGRTGPEPWDEGLPEFTQALMTAWPGNPGPFPLIQKALKAAFAEGMNPNDLKAGLQRWITAANNGESDPAFYPRPDRWLEGRMWLTAPPPSRARVNRAQQENDALMTAWMQNIEREQQATTIQARALPATTEGGHPWT